MTEPKKPLRQMAEQMFGNVNVNAKHLEHVEFMILRRYVIEHKAGDEVELARLDTALEVLRELGSS